ncbi:MAG: TspO and MBR-like protein [Sphingomonas bacterium]|nr:TspO and MBR-like protein [Sphingomonas bacterium]
MSQLASRGQLRMMFLRRALVTVPLVLLLGMASGLLSNSGYGNAWFASLRKPAFMPPGWAFGVAWTILYILQGIALAIVLRARHGSTRSRAVAAFVVQLALNLAWSPLFFAAHRVTAALWLIVAIFAAAAYTMLLFGRIRRTAAVLMLPYLAWLLFAAALNQRIDSMNPSAETLAPKARSTQISL